MVFCGTYSCFVAMAFLAQIIASRARQFSFKEPEASKLKMPVVAYKGTENVLGAAGFVSNKDCC